MIPIFSYRFPLFPLQSGGETGREITTLTLLTRNLPVRRICQFPDCLHRPAGYRSQCSAGREKKGPDIFATFDICIQFYEGMTRVAALFGISGSVSSIRNTENNPDIVSK
ncbi:hypothetical protein WA026_017626 [Henosepilachna vigintioctopunctata]|uniref:Uncharacterized protein n=1 Tax=Henosepilachna vigintioctopunctata TaxID=420089 RepID=A0AAW1UTA8_9CUCU